MRSTTSWIGALAVVLALSGSGCATAQGAAGTPATEVDDSRGGELVCGKEDTTMTIQVPPDRLVYVLEEIVAPQGMEWSDCTFTPAR